MSKIADHYLGVYETALADIREGTNLKENILKAIRTGLDLFLEDRDILIDIMDAIEDGE